MNVRRTEAESASLRAIWTRDLLDSQPELECEELVQLAAAICGTPVGLVTLLDERHQWFRASEHLKLGETPREVAFCAHAIRETELFLVKDALMDARFANNPLVTSDPAIRFFAGVGAVYVGRWGAVGDVVRGGHDAADSGGGAGECAGGAGPAGQQSGWRRWCSARLWPRRLRERKGARET